MEASLANYPDHVQSYINLGKAYFMADLPELAVASYEEALKRSPTNAAALRNLVTLNEAAGFHQAAASYRQRLDLLSGDAATAFMAQDKSKEDPPKEDPRREQAKTENEEHAPPPEPEGFDEPSIHVSHHRWTRMQRACAS